MLIAEVFSPVIRTPVVLTVQREPSLDQTPCPKPPKESKTHDLILLIDGSQPMT